jgi:hemerythrin-like domain-containing protein
VRYRQAMADDGIDRLEHDHIALSQRVLAVRSAVSRLQRGEDVDAAETVAALALLADDLFEHFAREEEFLFPYIVAELPDQEPQVAQMQAAHDRICGAASRIVALAERGPLAEQLALVLPLFARFDAEYMAHAQREAEFLRELASRLTTEQRRALAALLTE